MSLVVVATALPFRAAAIPFSHVVSHWPIIVNLRAGSLLGAWFDAGWAMPELLVLLWDTLNMATLGTLAGTILAVPVAFLAAGNTTPSKLFIRPVALFLIVASRSINSLIWALLLVSILGPVSWRASSPSRFARSASSASYSMRHAAFGGVYIAASIFWLWVVEGSRPDRWDVTGAVV